MATSYVLIAAFYYVVSAGDKIKPIHFHSPHLPRRFFDMLRNSNRKYLSNNVHICPSPSSNHLTVFNRRSSLVTCSSLFLFWPQCLTWIAKHNRANLSLHLTCPCLASHNPLPQTRLATIRHLISITITGARRFSLFNFSMAETRLLRIIVGLHYRRYNLNATRNANILLNLIALRIVVNLMLYCVAGAIYLSRLYVNRDNRGRRFIIAMQ